jgi:transposase
MMTYTSKSATAELMRVSWRSVGSIITRVVSDAMAQSDPFKGLRRIGIDKISYRRGHKYLTVVVDHDSGRLSGRPVSTRRPSKRSSISWVRSVLP